MYVFSREKALKGLKRYTEFINRVARLFYQKFAMIFLKFAIWEKKSPNI